MAVGVNIVSEFNAQGIKKAIAEFKKLEGAGAKSTYALRTLDESVTNGLANFGRLAAGVGIAAGAIGYKLASAAYESQKVMAQTQQIIRSTGAAAGLTAQQVADLSEKMSMQIGVDDELIQSTANLLLTFKQVQNQVGENNNVFDRALMAAQDLGNVFGSADAAAMQLGKALSDPVKGITALRRAGINFTQQQQEQIATMVKSGDVLGAQKLILAEVESQVGGTAAATATGFDKMRVAVGNVAEDFGTLLLPYIERFANFVNEKVAPYMSNLAEVIDKDGIGAALRIVGGDILNFTTNMGALGNTLLGLTAAFVALRLVTIAATISQVAFNTALLTNPIGIFVAAVIAIGVALAALYLKFEPVRKVIDMIGGALKKSFVDVAKAVFNFFAGAINIIIGAINGVIWVVNKLGGDIESIGYVSFKSFGDTASAAEAAAKRMAAAQKVAGRPFEQLVGDYRGSMPVIKQVGKETENTFGGAAKKVETVQEKIRGFIDALKGVTSAQRSVRDANKSVLKSNEDLAKANERLTIAQERFKRVVAGYGAASREARDQNRVLAVAQRRVERAGYGVEQAVFAVAEAEAELAAVRLDPEASPQKIREAEIALAEAKLAVKDATDDQTDATQELADAEQRLDEIINGAKEGSNAYKEALDELNEAKREQIEATDAVTDAYDRQRDAVDKLREAEEKLAESRKNTPDRLEARATRMLNTPLNITTPNMEVPDNVFTSPARNAMLAGMIPAFAAGGVVTAPTVGLIGEAGPEAVIPLDRMGSVGSTNVYVTVNAGMGTDPTAVADEIVNVLQKYNRRNGALPLKVM
jgi:hypothetical protein